MKICLDAGHYGRFNHSPVVSTYYESDFTWKFTNYEAQYLKEMGFEVILTRSVKEKDLDLFKRGQMAKGCDLFISNHSNACGTESVDRAVAIYPVGFNNIDVERNRKLATLIADNCANVMGLHDGYKVYSKPAGYDRNKNGLTDDEYYGVMHGAQSVKCPLYMIVEHSFHTNRKSATWLLVEDNVKKLAYTEALTIATFLKAKLEILVEDRTTPTIEYIVKKGDILTKIADNFNTTVEEIIELNPGIVNPNKIYIGQKLTVPSFLEGKVDDVNYIVKKGDTLSKIAKANDTTWAKLMLINGLSVTTIYPGQVIKIR